jgi:WD40 repeat protein
MSKRWHCLIVGFMLIAAHPLLAAGPAEKAGAPVLRQQHHLPWESYSLSFSSKGTELAVCVKADVKILDADTLKVRKTFLAAGRRAAFVRKDGFLVVSGVFQQGMELLDRRSGDWEVLNYGDTDFACRGERDLLAYRGTGKDGATVNVYDLAAKKVLRRWEVDDPVSRPVLGGFSNKGVLLASYTKDRAEGGRLIVTSYLLAWPPPYDGDPVKIEMGTQALSLAISADGLYAGVGTATGKSEIWDLRTRKRVSSMIHSHRGPVEAVAFSPDGRLFASLVTDRRARRTGKPRGLGNSEVLLWDIRAGRELGAVEVSKELTLGLAFFPDGKRLITAGKDGVKVWTINSRTGAARKVTTEGDR